MSSLTALEKRTFERFLRMNGGYVLTFSDRTMRDYFLDTVRRDIDDPKYSEGNSGSKANRMRAFWRIESDAVVSRLLANLLEWAGGSLEDDDRAEVEGIVQRLQQGVPAEDLDALEAASGKDFEALTKSVREAIERDEPEVGLDRLHTFTVKYMRVLCDRHGITTEREKPLHSLMGEYLKALKRRAPLESEMTERILKSTISIFEAFNDVRNEHSLAHDNALLARSEAHLIVGHILGVIRFLSSLEGLEPDAARAASDDWDKS